MKKSENKQDFVLQVDSSDRPIGLIEKKNAHLLGVLHRAFSIFIFREIESSYQLLLQKRAFEKYHSPGLWTNTCCSHAESDIDVEITAKKRLQIEMGFSCDLSFLGTFYYKAEVGNGMIEHEMDHVFATFHNPKHIQLNPEEASAFEWINIDDLQELLIKDTHKYTAWLPGALKFALKFLKLS